MGGNLDAWKNTTCSQQSKQHGCSVSIPAPFQTGDSVSKAPRSFALGPESATDSLMSRVGSRTTTKV